MILDKLMHVYTGVGEGMNSQAQLCMGWARRDKERQLCSLQIAHKVIIARHTLSKIVKPLLKATDAIPLADTLQSAFEEQRKKKPIIG